MKRVALCAAIAAAAGFAAPASAQFVLNEVYVNPPGTDDTREFIEICGTPGAALTNVWVLEIEGDGAGAGVIDSARNLSSFSLGSNGLLVLGHNYETSNPWGITAPTVTANLNRGAVTTLENGSITFLLVTDFTGAVGNDIGDEFDVFTSTPWSGILDSVGWRESDTGVNAVYGGVILTQSSGTQDAASRFPGTTDRNAASWFSGDIVDGPLALDVEYSLTQASANIFPGAVITPGAKNVPTPGALVLGAMGGLIAARRRRA